MLKLIDKTIDPNAPAVDLVNPSNSTVADEPPEEYGPYTEVIAIPGKVEAENYNKGGAEVAYHDESKGNEGGKLRRDGVDIYQPNMGIVVGYCEKGDWMKYSVNVAEAGEYEIFALVAGDNGSGSIAIYMDDKLIGSEIVNTGKGFDTFETVKAGSATLTAGEHELKLEVINSWIDIDYVEFTKIGSSVVAGSSASAAVIDPATSSASVTIPATSSASQISAGDPMFAGNLHLSITEAESNFALVDLQGRLMARIKANSLSEAVRMVKASGKLNAKGAYYMVNASNKKMIQKVVVNE